MRKTYRGILVHFTALPGRSLGGGAGRKISYELFVFCRNIQGVLWTDLQGDDSHGKTAKSGGLIAIHRF